MKKLVMLAALAGVAYGGWRWQHHAPADAEGKLFRDRLWIDHLPRGERDMVNVFIVMSEEPVGLFNNTSMWKGSYESFRYELSEHQLQVIYPQTGDRERVRVRARRCKDEGMDYCLELDGASRGVKRYYSREGWEIGSLDAGRAKLDAIEHQAAR
jgi:hypothetical protein